MSIEYTKVDATTRQAFYDTLLTFWGRNWQSEFQQDFLDWRYGRRPDGETLIAMQGSTCMGLIDTFIRPYIVGGQQVLVREPCDWYCVPTSRGIGMRLLRWLATQDELLVGVGLPAGALAIAPRMKWKHMLDTNDYAIPITLRRVAAALLRKSRIGDGSVTKYLPRRLHVRPASSWARHTETDGEVSEIAADKWPEEEWSGVQDLEAYALTPVCTRSYVQWLASGPAGLGKVTCLEFRVKQVLVGLTICRIEASKVGRKARLIHLQAARPNLNTLAWMIAENVRRATHDEAESLHCRSSCPTTNAALVSLGFHRTATWPVMAAFKDLPTPSGPVNMTFLRGDDAMIPSLIGE